MPATLGELCHSVILKSIDPKCLGVSYSLFFWEYWFNPERQPEHRRVVKRIFELDKRCEQAKSSFRIWTEVNLLTHTERVNFGQNQEM